MVGFDCRLVDSDIFEYRYKITDVGMTISISLSYQYTYPVRIS